MPLLFPIKIAYLCVKLSKRGALIRRAEIIPILPDPGNAGGGKR